MSKRRRASAAPVVPAAAEEPPAPPVPAPVSSSVTVNNTPAPTKGTDESVELSTTPQVDTADATAAARPPEEVTASAPKLTSKNAPTIPYAKGEQFHCDMCRKDITHLVRIRCAECDDFDLCVDCFAVGAEVTPHKNYHSYHVVDKLNFPLFVEDWGADEELLLLEGIEMYGLGNWTDIADHVASKTKTKCEIHYRDIYLYSATAPLPDTTHILSVRDEDGKLKIIKHPGNPLSEAAKEEREKEEREKEERERKAAGGVLTSDRVARPNASQNKNNSHSAADVVGYMPLRGDFDVEYDNDAELILADMEFNDDDTPAEKQLKLRVLDIYNNKLDERARRKTFVIERGLLDLKKQQALDRKRSKEERDIHNQMRIFARFQSAEEHEQLVQGLIAEKRLRKRIEQLQHYRSLGIRTLAEAETLESEKKKRDSEVGSKRGRDSSAYLFDGNKAAAAAQRRNRYLNRDKTDEPASKVAKKETDAPLNLAGTPNVDILTDKERDLCSLLHILPQHYQTIKQTLLVESLRLGYLTREMTQNISELDAHKTGKLYDFFVSAGWVKSDSASGSLNGTSQAAVSTVTPATVSITASQPPS
eukprot:GILK01003563.1.p1 GENE.GILK01003563.1~~GILK01003563.1.p1  ORF type:complete len:591 (+),score=112.18 GILK01003563.1:139-1911(+)